MSTNNLKSTSNISLQAIGKQQWPENPATTLLQTMIEITNIVSSLNFVPTITSMPEPLTVYKKILANYVEVYRVLKGRLFEDEGGVGGNIGKISTRTVRSLSTANQLLANPVDNNYPVAGLKSAGLTCSVVAAMVLLYAVLKNRILDICQLYQNIDNICNSSIEHDKNKYEFDMQALLGLLLHVMKHHVLSNEIVNAYQIRLWDFVHDQIIDKETGKKLIGTEEHTDCIGPFQYWKEKIIEHLTEKVSGGKIRLEHTCRCCNTTKTKFDNLPCVPVFAAEIITPVKSFSVSGQNVTPNLNLDVTLQNRIDTYFEETLFNDLSNGNKLDADVYVSCDTCLRTNVNEGAEFLKDVASAKCADVIITSSDKRGVGLDSNVGKSY
jgi:hypothetical protein